MAQVTEDTRIDEARFVPDAGPTYVLSDKLTMLSDPEGIQAESIRALRTHMIAQHIRDGRRSLAVCATATGAGCTFLSANLAVALAQTGVKTLLIDGNLRDPEIDQYFVPDRQGPGLYQCLSDADMSLGEAIHEGVQPNLSIMFAGSVAPDAQEVLGTAKFKSLVDLCLRDYDLTIIDTPAANTFADARRIASVMRYAMIVTQRNRTFVRDVRMLVSELRADRAQVVGTYLNDY